MSIKHMCVTILIYGASEAALYSILWPMLEKEEIRGHESPSIKGNFLSNSSPPQCVFYDKLCH
jgi:hypothetical protein